MLFKGFRCKYLLVLRSSYLNGMEFNKLHFPLFNFRIRKKKKKKRSSAYLNLIYYVLLSFILFCRTLINAFLKLFCHVPLMAHTCHRFASPSLVYITLPMRALFSFIVYKFAVEYHLCAYFCIQKTFVSVTYRLIQNFLDFKEVIT